MTTSASDHAAARCRCRPESCSSIITRCRPLTSRRRPNTSSMSQRSRGRACPAVAKHAKSRRSNAAKCPKSNTCWVSAAWQSEVKNTAETIESVKIAVRNFIHSLKLCLLYFLGYKAKSLRRHEANDVIDVDITPKPKRGSDASSVTSRDTLFINNNELPTVKYDVIPEGSQESFEDHLSGIEVCGCSFK